MCFCHFYAIAVVYSGKYKAFRGQQQISRASAILYTRTLFNPMERANQMKFIVILVFLSLTVYTVNSVKVVTWGRATRHIMGTEKILVPPAIYQTQFYTIGFPRVNLNTNFKIDLTNCLRFVSFC